MKRWLLCLIPIISSFVAVDASSAQEPPPPTQPTLAITPTPATAPANPDAVPPGGTRVLGVLPNYRTADISQEGTVLTSRQKLSIAAKDSFDYPLVGLSAIIAGLGQASDSHKSFGQGGKGYAHRFGTTYADEALGNMFTEGLFPIWFHEDPRYFRLGTGSIKRRTWYALTRVFITHTDSGKERFNYSEWVGNAASTAISNAYYSDNRTAGENASKLVVQVGTDALSQVLKEFWPDVKRKFFTRRNRTS